MVVMKKKEAEAARVDDARPTPYTRVVVKVTLFQPNWSTSGPARKLKKLENARAKLKISETFVEDVRNSSKKSENSTPKQLVNMDAIA